MVRIVRRVVVVLAVAALIGAAGLAFAQALPVPVNIQPVGPAPGGLSTMVTFDARGVGGASNAGYYTRPVLVSNNTLGGLARGLLRRSVPVLAMTALIEAAGWAIDELTGQVIIPGSDGNAPPAGSAVWCTSSWGSNYGGKMCGPSPQSFIGMSPGWPGGTSIVTGYAPQTSTVGTLQAAVNGQPVGGMTVQVVAYQPSVHSWINATPDQPVPDADVGALVRNNPHVWNDALRNADGSVNRNPDVMAEAQRLADALLNPDPVTNPAPDPVGEWDSGYQGGEPQPRVSPEPWPALCEWASVICEWLDWTQQEPVWGEDEDGLPLPVHDPLDNMPSFSPGLGAGSCPAPQEVNTVVGTISIPFDIFCGLASALYPLVLAAAYLTGAFIIVGVRRG